MRVELNEIFLLLLLISGLYACKGERTYHFKEGARSRGNDVYDKYSFVISCGSGCALNYSSEKILSKDLSFEIRFKVKMYINQKLSEEYMEVYIIRYNKEGEVTQIKNKNDTVGELHPRLTEELKTYVDFLLKQHKKGRSNSNKETEIKSSKLIYNEKINLNNVEYKILEQNIKGTEKFLCNKNKLRYIELPQKSDIRLILVPMDCGDFPYRFYLLTIKERKVISDIYAEGEWSEPGDEHYKERTFFSIDENYTINITKDLIEDGIVVRTESAQYLIQDSGKLKLKD